MIWTSTRHAIHDALAWGWLNRSDMGMLEHIKLHCRVQKSNTHNNNARIQDSLEAGYILAAIDSQRPIVRAWLYFAYHFQDRPHDRAEVACELFSRLFGGEVRQDKIAPHRALCEVSVDDYRFRLLRNNPIPTECYTKNMKVNPKNFSRDFGDKRDKCLDSIGNFDKEGIANVSVIVRSIRGEIEETPSEILTMKDSCA